MKLGCFCAFVSKPEHLDSSATKPFDQSRLFQESEAPSWVYPFECPCPRSGRTPAFRGTLPHHEAQIIIVSNLDGFCDSLVATCSTRDKFNPTLRLLPDLMERIEFPLPNTIYNLPNFEFSSAVQLLEVYQGGKN